MVLDKLNGTAARNVKAIICETFLAYQFCPIYTQIFEILKAVILQSKKYIVSGEVLLLMVDNATCNSSTFC